MGHGGFVVVVVVGGGGGLYIKFSICLAQVSGTTESSVLVDVTSVQIHNFCQFASHPFLSNFYFLFYSCV